MGSKERREREREKLRGRILDAARELFAAEGYEAVTMRKIAQRIEYSPTAIYLHFKDKRAVMRALCDTDFLALAGQFHRVAAIADPIERIRAAGRAYAAFAFAHPNHYRLMFMTAHPEDSVEESAIEKGNPDQDAYAFLRMAVEQAIAAGRFGPAVVDPDLIAQLLWSGLHGLIALQCTHCDDPWVTWKPREELVERMMDALLSGLGGSQD